MSAVRAVHVIGIDPDRDRVTAAVAESATTAETAAAVFEATRSGYARLLEWADRHTSEPQRVWAVEGTGGYGAGVTSHVFDVSDIGDAFRLAHEPHHSGALKVSVSFG